MLNDLKLVVVCLCMGDYLSFFLSQYEITFVVCDNLNDDVKGNGFIKEYLI